MKEEAKSLLAGRDWFWDNLLKENQKLVSRGIQGETYEVDKNGRFYRTEESINGKFGFKQIGWNWPISAIYWNRDSNDNICLATA